MNDDEPGPMLQIDPRLDDRVHDLMDNLLKPGEEFDKTQDVMERDSTSEADEDANSINEFE